MEMLKCRSWDKLKVVVLGWQVLESVWFVWILNSFVVMNLPDGPSTKASANFLAGSCAYFLLGLRLPAQRLFSLCFLFAPTDLKSIDQWLIGLVCKHALTYTWYTWYTALLHAFAAYFSHLLLAELTSPPNDSQVYGMDSTFKAVHPCEEVYGELSSTSRPQVEAAVEEIGPPKWAKWVETCGDCFFLNRAFWGFCEERRIEILSCFV